MSEHIRLFVNERPVDVAAGCTVRDAVRAADASLAEHLNAGDAFVTDGRGIALPPDVLVSPGAILRVVIPARRSDAVGEDDANA